MVVKFIIALILPGALVILFTRVTYNYYVGTALSLALMIGAVIKGYSDSTIIIITDIVSIVMGFFYSKRMAEKSLK